MRLQKQHIQIKEAFFTIFARGSGKSRQFVREKGKEPADPYGVSQLSIQGSPSDHCSYSGYINRNSKKVNEMGGKLKTHFLIALTVIVLLGSSLWYISHNAQEIVEHTGTGGVVTFYDADSGDIRKIRSDPASTKVFATHDGTRYVLQSENLDRTISIYDANGSKLKEALLAGEHIATSNRNDVIIQKTFGKNKKTGEMTYDYGIVLSETQDKIQKDDAEHTTIAKIIMWSDSALAIILW
jgi:hypothetical protein